MTSPLKGDALTLRKLCLQVSDLTERVMLLEKNAAYAESRVDGAHEDLESIRRGSAETLRDLRERVTSLEEDLDFATDVGPRLNACEGRLTELEQERKEERIAERVTSLERDTLRSLDTHAERIEDNGGWIEGLLGRVTALEGRAMKTEALLSQVHFVQNRGLASQAGQGKEVLGKTLAEPHATDTGGSGEPAPVAELLAAVKDSIYTGYNGGRESHNGLCFRYIDGSVVTTPDSCACGVKERRIRNAVAAVEAWLQRGPQTEAPIAGEYSGRGPGQTVNLSSQGTEGATPSSPSNSPIEIRVGQRLLWQGEDVLVVKIDVDGTTLVRLTEDSSCEWWETTSVLAKHATFISEPEPPRARYGCQCPPEEPCECPGPDASGLYHDTAHTGVGNGRAAKTPPRPESRLTREGLLGVADLLMFMGSEKPWLAEERRAVMSLLRALSAIPSTAWAALLDDAEEWDDEEPGVPGMKAAFRLLAEMEP